MQAQPKRSSIFFFIAAVLASDSSRGSVVPVVWIRTCAKPVREDHGTYRSSEFLGMVLIMELSFCAWYLLCSAVSVDGTYYGPQCQTMVLNCDVKFLHIGRAYVPKWYLFGTYQMAQWYLLWTATPFKETFRLVVFFRG